MSVLKVLSDEEIRQHYLGSRLSAVRDIAEAQRKADAKAIVERLATLRNVHTMDLRDYIVVFIAELESEAK